MSSVAGDLAESFFMVDSGCIVLSYPEPNTGRLLPIRQLKKGDVFGASGLLVGDLIDNASSGGNAMNRTPGRRRDTATALEPTVLKVVPHAQFATIVQDSLIQQSLARSPSMREWILRATLQETGEPNTRQPTSVTEM